MPRYFIEVSYKGTMYAGFQTQQNANTVQDEVEKALQTYFRQKFKLTGSSRTDAGVHALQNFFHVDSSLNPVPDWNKAVYHLNAILPPDIVIKRIFPVKEDAHSRFDAKYRSYEYSLYATKDPFLADRAYFYPYKLDIDSLNEAAALIKSTENFESFAKRNSQVKSFRCIIYESDWFWRNDNLIYAVSGNRFLRGMVRGLTGTMLKVGRGKTSLGDFKRIIQANDASLADFSVPPQGLNLVKVAY